MASVGLSKLSSPLFKVYSKRPPPTLDSDLPSGHPATVLLERRASNLVSAVVTLSYLRFPKAQQILGLFTSGPSLHRHPQLVWLSVIPSWPPLQSLSQSPGTARPSWCACPSSTVSPWTWLRTVRSSAGTSSPRRPLSSQRHLCSQCSCRAP